MNATAKLIPLGMDIAKNVFQLYWVEPSTGEIKNIRVRRAKLLEHFANQPPVVVGMEACGGAQYWARELRKLGHEVRLLDGKEVKKFVTRNKSDAIDARAVWQAMQQSPARFVPVKTELQQAVLALHSMRRQLVKIRTMQINALRGLLTEYGEVFGRGRKALTQGLQAALERVAMRLPQAVIDTLRLLWQRVGQLDQEVAQIERSLRQMLAQDPLAQRFFEMPGVGLLGATAFSASIADAQSFRSGRNFSAWLGVVPRHTGSGGKNKLHGISKRGDTYLRTLLIHGARSAVTHTKHPNAWQQGLLDRRPKNVAVVAVANKMARTLWAIAAHGSRYDPNLAASRAFLPVADMAEAASRRPRPRRSILAASRSQGSLRRASPALDNV